MKNHLGLFRPDGSLDMDATLAVLGLSLSDALNIFKLRADDKSRPKLEAKMRELACAIEFVSETFDGCRQKTQFWFRTPNARFHGLSPLDLILVRRYRTVYDFIFSNKLSSSGL